MAPGAGAVVATLLTLGLAMARPGAAAEPKPGPPDARLLLDLDLLQEADLARQKDMLRRLRLLERFQLLESLKVLETQTETAPSVRGAGR